MRLEMAHEYQYQLPRHEFILRRDLMVVIKEQWAQRDPRQLVQHQEKRLAQTEQRLVGGSLFGTSTDIPPWAVA